MIMKTTEAGGKTLYLDFGVRSYLAIEARYGSFEEFTRRIREHDRPYEAQIALAAACASNGNRLRGIEEEITEEWLTDNLSKREMDRVIAEAVNAYITGMRREHVGGEDEDVDVVAQEIKKKPEQDAR